MAVIGTRFGITLSLQLILLIFDLILNSASVFYRDSVWIVLGIFVSHVLIIIIALILMLTTFFSTYVFKVGLVDILVQRFRCTILILFLYFLLTITYYIWTLVVLWGYTTDHRWGNATIGIYVAQKSVAPIYYYYYKRSALRISDPRFYEDIKWEQNIPQQPNK